MAGLAFVLSIQQPCSSVFIVPLLSKNSYIMEQNNNYLGKADISAGQNSASNEQLLTPPPEQRVENNPYKELEDGLKGFFGDDFDLSDSFSQETLMHHLYINKEQNRRLAEAFERDPRLAQMLIDMIEGKRNAHSAVARYFGRQFVEMDENSPEYKEMLVADEERKAEAVRLAEERREYENNLQESLPVIESFCEEQGYNPSQFMDDVWEQIVFPILAGKYSKEVCTALDHALTYEKDVEDAFAAGDIKGRNTNILRMKEDFGDGMPKGLNSVAPDTEIKRNRNSLIEKALNA